MARLRDIKVGMTVWIKKGRTPPGHFGAEAESFVGQKLTVLSIDGSDPHCQIETEDYWFPVDWISLTPPKEDPSLKGVASNEASKETLPKKTSKKLYVAVSGCEVTEPGTLEQVVNFLQDYWNCTEDEIIATKIYELTEVKIKYTPAKYEVVE